MTAGLSLALRTFIVIDNALLRALYIFLSSCLELRVYSHSGLVVHRVEDSCFYFDLLSLNFKCAFFTKVACIYGV